MDVVEHFNIQRMRWLGHIVRMEDDAPTRRVLDGEEYDHVSVGTVKSRKPCHRLSRSRGAWWDVLPQAEIR